MADPRFYDVAAPLTLEELAEKLQLTLADGADKDMVLAGVAPLDKAEITDVTFLSNKKYSAQLAETKAGACVVEPSEAHKAPEGIALIVSDNPYYTYALVARYFYPNHAPLPEDDAYIAANAVVADTAVIGNGCRIEAGVVIEDGVEIGDCTIIGANSVIARGVQIGAHCRIGSNVSISHAILGDKVRLHHGVRIGQSGFGFATHHGQHVRVPQLGRVIVKNGVDIGANTTIDRGAGPDTVIGEGCQIDNLVQIGHNVQLGRGCVVVAQVGIAGSTQLGDYVVLGGQVGVAGHLKVGSGAQLAAQAGVTKNIPEGMMAGGTPAVPIRQWHKQAIALKKLTEAGSK